MYHPFLGAWWTQPVLSKAGIRGALTESAAYPYQFGVAVAELLPPRGLRPEGFEIDLDEGGESSGCLDDFLKGPPKTWWRNL